MEYQRKASVRSTVIIDIYTWAGLAGSTVGAGLPILRQNRQLETFSLPFLDTFFSDRYTYAIQRNVPDEIFTVKAACGDREPFVKRRVSVLRGRRSKWLITDKPGHNPSEQDGSAALQTVRNLKRNGNEDEKLSICIADHDAG